mmetsp:Transcript_85391/g.236639  ORF Transcript_85391/g.236639 Transcript_85391/m.236639 type:complete len:200 (+) Transcript_85391:239-838(+)
MEAKLGIAFQVPECYGDHHRFPLTVRGLEPQDRICQPTWSANWAYDASWCELQLKRVLLDVLEKRVHFLHHGAAQNSEFRSPSKESRHQGIGAVPECRVDDGLQGQDLLNEPLRLSDQIRRHAGVARRRNRGRDAAWVSGSHGPLQGGLRSFAAPRVLFCLLLLRFPGLALGLLPGPALGFLPLLALRLLPGLLLSLRS